MAAETVSVDSALSNKNNGARQYFGASTRGPGDAESLLLRHWTFPCDPGESISISVLYCCMVGTWPHTDTWTCLSDYRGRITDGFNKVC